MMDLLFGSPIFIIDCPDAEGEALATETIAVSSKFKKELHNPWNGNILTTFTPGNPVNIIKNFCPILNKHILKSTNQFLRELQTDVDYSFIDLYDSWINYADRGMYQEVHSHPYSDISGVFYSQADTDSGEIYFIAPSTSYCHSELVFRSKLLQDNVKVSPKNNRLILFPSWLQHGTLPNKSNDTRISMSFNIKLIP